MKRPVKEALKQLAVKKQAILDEIDEVDRDIRILEHARLTEDIIRRKYRRDDGIS